MPDQPTYPGVYLEEIPGGIRAIPGVPTSITAFIGCALQGPVNEPILIGSFGDFERLFGGLWTNSTMSYAVQDFYLNGGHQAMIVRIENSAVTGAIPDIPDYEGDPDLKTGIYALLKTDLFNLLCIPPPERGADTPASVYVKALKFCAGRRAVLLVDPPQSWGANADAAVSIPIASLETLGLSGAEAHNAALYYPLVLRADPLRENQPDLFVPCGIIAGLMAKTDINHGVWKSPAGIDASIQGILGLQVNLSDHETGQLNPLGINCLRNFPDSRMVVWGARTMRGADQQADEYKYIAVRRTALFIEESLVRGTQWVVYEPNDEPLWSQIRLNIVAFMHSLFRQGAFRGSKPEEAYFVKCDRETTTQNDIQRGVVNIIVGFAPLKPAEFVIIQIQQITGQDEYQNEIL